MIKNLRELIPMGSPFLGQWQHRGEAVGSSRMLVLIRVIVKD